MLVVAVALPARASDLPATESRADQGGQAQDVDVPKPSGGTASDRLSESASTGASNYNEVVNAPDFHYAPAPSGGDALEKGESYDSDVAVGTVTPNITAGKCKYDGKADHPHKSNNEASVHGYWVRLGGACPSTAKVTVDLSAYACASGSGCVWVTQNTKSGTFTPGSGTGHWATPHKGCSGASTVGWRGRVDVDLTNVSDPSGYQYSTAVDLACHP